MRAQRLLTVGRDMGWRGRSVHSVHNRVGSSNFSAPASVALLTSYAAR